MQIGDKIVNTETGSVGVVTDRRGEYWHFDFGHGEVGMVDHLVRELLTRGELRKATLLTTETVHVAFWCVAHKCVLIGEPNWFPMKGDDQNWIIDLAYMSCPKGDEQYEAEDGMGAGSDIKVEHSCRNDTDKWLQVFCVEE